MAKPSVQITLEEIEELAWLYALDCLKHRKEHPTASGKIVNILDRKIPTISYFLNIWIPLNGKPTISRTTYYNWLKGKDQDKLDTIKRIEGVFEALAVDIVANEGKGIFYAKNKLKMSDKGSDTFITNYTARYGDDTSAKVKPFVIDIQRTTVPLVIK